MSYTVVQACSLLVVHPFSYTVSTLEEHCLSVLLLQLCEETGSDMDTVVMWHLEVVAG